MCLWVFVSVCVGLWERNVLKFDFGTIGTVSGICVRVYPCVWLCFQFVCQPTTKKIRSTRNLTTSSICISSNVIYIKVHKIYFFAWENRKCYNSIRFLLLREQNIISALFSDFITGVWCCSFRCEWCWNVKIRRTFFGFIFLYKKTVNIIF